MAQQVQTWEAEGFKLVMVEADGHVYFVCREHPACVAKLTVVHYGGEVTAPYWAIDRLADLGRYSGWRITAMDHLQEVPSFE